MNLLIVLAVASVLLLLLARLRLRRTADVAGPEARRLVEGGARLVDVRTSREFASGHLPGAVNVPLAELERRMSTLGPRDRPLVLYCHSGSRSAVARRMLVAGGFTAVHDLGAMRSW